MIVLRSFSAWEERIGINPDVEHAHRQRLTVYRDKLVYGGVVLPDPFSLQTGWLDEGQGITQVKYGIGHSNCAFFSLVLMTCVNTLMTCVDTLESQVQSTCITMTFESTE